LWVYRLTEFLQKPNGRQMGLVRVIICKHLHGLTNYNLYEVYEQDALTSDDYGRIVAEVIQELRTRSHHLLIGARSLF
jgi:5-formaminoimidazole-4-carboxamide-1-beta-D-ribofuranosyl 5'-monophosphate synthetase